VLFLRLPQAARLPSRPGAVPSPAARAAQQLRTSRHQTRHMRCLCTFAGLACQTCQKHLHKVKPCSSCSAHARPRGAFWCTGRQVEASCPARPRVLKHVTLWTCWISRQLEDMTRFAENCMYSPCA